MNCHKTWKPSLTQNTPFYHIETVSQKNMKSTRHHQRWIKDLWYQYTSTLLYQKFNERSETNFSCKHNKPKKVLFARPIIGFVCSFNNWWPPQHAVPKLDQLSPPLKKDGHWQLTRQPKLCQVLYVQCILQMLFFPVDQSLSGAKQDILQFF